MRAFLSLRRNPSAVAVAQTALCVATFIGLLLFADQLGATTPGKHLRTGVQSPSGVKAKGPA